MVGRSDIVTLNAYAVGCARQISDVPPPTSVLSPCAVRGRRRPRALSLAETLSGGVGRPGCGRSCKPRSEEHTSELQSLRHLVCRLLLEKKNIHTLMCHSLYLTLP